MATVPIPVDIIPPITRAGRPTFPPEVARVYVAALDAIEEHRIPYVLGGAVALSSHTDIWRDTKDLDVFVRPADATRALDALAAADFRTEIKWESWLGKGWRGELFVDIIWRNANALFQVDDAWISRAVRAPILGRERPVLAPEELLASKLMVMGRHRFDGADITHLLYTRADTMDWDRLAELCGEHAELLLAYLHMFRWTYPGERDKVPETVLSSFRERATRSRSSFGPFRGRLLDLATFTIDVEAWGLPDAHRIALERIFGDATGRS